MDVTLQDMLDARDRRAAYQRKLLSRFPQTSLLMFTVNWPGPNKDDPIASRVFTKGMIALIRMCDKHHIKTKHFEVFDRSTGGEVFICAPVSAAFLKHIACELEESVPYGRLWDMDVLDESGAPVSRETLGREERACIVCGAAGRGCASRRLHSLEETLFAAHALAASIEDASGGEGKE